MHGKRNKKYINIKYIEIYIFNTTYYMCSIYYTVADTEVATLFFDGFQNIQKFSECGPLSVDACNERLW